MWVTAELRRRVTGRWHALLARVLLALAGVTCVLSPVSVAFAQRPSVAQAERAEQLYRLGSEAFEEGRYAEALRALRQAYASYPTYRTVCTLGQVELHLEHYRDAAEHLDSCARSFPDSESRRVLRQVVEGLADARQHVFVLTLRSNVDGARVSLDGNPVAETPIDTDLFVEPGKHVVSVDKPGYEGFRAEVFLPAGGQRQLQASLVANRDTPRHASGSAPQLRRAVLWGGGALTVGALTSGVVLRILGADVARQAEDVAVALGERRRGCADQPDLACRELKRLHERSARQYRASDIALLSATGVALGTLAFVVGWGWGDSEEGNASDALRFSVNAGEGEAQVGVSGVF